MDTIRIDVQGEHSPAYLGDALNFIMSNLETAFQLNDVAAAARVSERTLHLAFQANFGVAVMAFVRQRRLELAYRQLLAADWGSTSVTVVALSCGFQHLGRFSAAYRQYFNELPSETLKRSKSSTARTPIVFEGLAAQRQGANRATNPIHPEELASAWPAGLGNPEQQRGLA